VLCVHVRVHTAYPCVLHIKQVDTYTLLCVDTMWSLRAEQCSAVCSCRLSATLHAAPVITTTAMYLFQQLADSGDRDAAAALAPHVISSIGMPPVSQERAGYSIEGSTASDTAPLLQVYTSTI
jgi:hypothetical protein